MAPANTTSSPRDHAADDNPDLARKRQRLSEDPGASPEGSVIIEEVGGPEDFGSNMENAIRIEDDPGLTASYQEAFQHFSKFSPVEQLRFILDRLAKNHYLDPALFSWFADAFARHIAETTTESQTWNQHYLEDEAEFFNTLARVSYELLAVGDLFDSSVDLGHGDMQTAFTNFVISVQTLCRRTIPLLPAAVKTTLSRRDSAHGSSRPQTLDSLIFLLVAERALDTRGAAVTAFCSVKHATKLKDAFRQGVMNLTDDRVFQATTSLIQDISGSARQLKDSWAFLDSALATFFICVDLRPGDQFPKVEVEAVLDVLYQSIKPAVCGKHPRALPELFHVKTLTWGECLINSHAQSSKGSSAENLYERFLKSSTDALFPQATGNESTATSLWRISGRDDKVSANLLGMSWFLQGATAFIRSDIMDVRTAGAIALKDRLIGLHTDCGKMEDGFEHPIVQYVVRFLRENEMTAYIFGPESHAGLINQGRDVIVFLAATNTHTRVETDIIWRACTTSVEADFAKAAVGVLRLVMLHLDLDHLFYILEKYATTPVTEVGTQAVDFLPELVTLMERRTIDAKDEPNRLKVAFAGIELLKHADTDSPSALISRIRHCAMAAIGRFANSRCTFEQRAEIYKYCVPEVLQMSQHATTAFEVFSYFIGSGVPPAEINLMLDLLPICAAVDELCHSARAQNGHGDADVDIHAVTIRLDTILRMMQATEAKVDAATCERLYTDVFGSADIMPAVRNAAWEKLHRMASVTAADTPATRLWQGFMQDHVPSLPAELASAELVQMVSMQVRSQCSSAEVQADYTKMLRLPLWHAIERFAVSSSQAQVKKLGIDVILDMLFDFPSKAQVPTASILRCHAEFAMALLDKLGQSFRNVQESDNAEDGLQFLNGMTLLFFLLRASKVNKILPELDADHELLVVDEAKGPADGMILDVQIYGPEIQPLRYRAMARQSTKVPTLLSSLPQVTSAGQHRIIAGGLEITHENDKTLAELGVHHLGVLMIRPVFATGDDIDKCVTPAGPVEQEILAQYSSVEAFLTGPDPLAQKALPVLQEVRLTSEAREKVTSGSVSLVTLFPADKPYRTRYSLFVLQKQLHYHARLAVADQDFSLRAVQMLTELMMDDTRSTHPMLQIDIVSLLGLFLRERPSRDQAHQYFRNPEAFVSRTKVLLSEAQALPLHLSSPSGEDRVRTVLATTLYKTLLDALEADEALFQAVSSGEKEMISIHQQLLLDEFCDFSKAISGQIETICQHPYTSRDMPHFFWRTLFPVLPAALEKKTVAAPYFNLLVRVLEADHKMMSNEEDVRSLVDMLLSKLWSYHHSETPMLLLQDQGAAGLLQLLKATTVALKKRKIPLDLDDLPSQLLQNLLFPSSIGPSHPYPLIHEGSRALVYDLVRATFGSKTDYWRLLGTVRSAIQMSREQAKQSFPGVQNWLRPSICSAGLSNLGMTCYMNSLLQQLFANLQFRKFILDQPIHDIRKQEVLSVLQTLFASMQDGIEPCADTTQLANVLGVQIGVQEDVHTFYTTMLSRLEDNMPTGEQKAALKGFFTGKSITQIQGDCGHVSSREEPFTELSITVKEKTNLFESLEEFVQGEPLAGANKYKCMTCEEGEGRLVNAMKRTCLEEVPDTLTLCLKRFAFDNLMEGENKVNDRFEFPAEIDMSTYKRGYLEDPQSPQQPDMFELVGVIVHQGTLSFGHYWSYIRVAGLPLNHHGAWVLVEDTRSIQIPGAVQEVQKRCFGGVQGSNGTELTDNGYVLVYQRNSYAMQARDFNLVVPSLQGDVLPKVSVPAALLARLEDCNLWRINIAALFNEGFAALLVMLLEQFPSVVGPQLGSSDSDVSAETLSTTNTAEDGIIALMGDTVAQYALRVLVCDPEAKSKLASLDSGLTAILEARPAVAVHILRIFRYERLAFKIVLHAKHSAVRTAVYNMVQTCLECIREHNFSEYESAVDDIVEMHGSMLDDELDDAHGDYWAEYLAFAANLARQGPYETHQILEKDYLVWTFEAVFTRWDAKSREAHPSVLQWMKSNNNYDYAPLFAFLYELLGCPYVDLSMSEVKTFARDERLQTSRGWSLAPREMELIKKTHVFREKHGQQWLLHGAMCRTCSTKGRWQDWAPGKLIGLLADATTHQDVQHLVELGIIAGVNIENTKLTPLLWSSYFYCQSTDDRFCKQLMQTLAHNLPLWENSERRTLYFFSHVYDMAPVSVIDNVPIWILHNSFLHSQNADFRQLTLEWLQGHLFSPDSLSSNSALDAARMRTTRSLVKQCTETLRTMMYHNYQREPMEAMISAMDSAKDYLSRLQTEVQALLLSATEDDPDANVSSSKVAAKAGLSTEMQVEFGESKAALAKVEMLLTDLEQWEAEETTLPTRSVGVRRSFAEEEELGDTELEGDEEEWSSEGASEGFFGE
ncbi:uncharacterized protein LTR77_001846 [Saxophila tyrrhenica]|uniref:USP domain-containing protein n=1 Tax=Saxophila tyrrhenica TaxID=1690608 RepID=A0AAV9PLK5_9PEZI|nr:hypothetical protein LTR77_001846 [Saxophila tyrrhenica]